jgi:hypothetical protein
LCLLHPISWFGHFHPYFITKTDLLSIATTIFTTIAMAMAEIGITASTKRAHGTDCPRSIIHVTKRDMKAVENAKEEDEREIRPPGESTRRSRAEPVGIRISQYQIRSAH